ncbi:MAG: hypothetical protein JKX78_00590 [Alteromonadaceae bacterium]|nr:hypothetical protein [Alteromonadaceae bacterium]
MHCSARKLALILFLLTVQSASTFAQTHHNEQLKSKYSATFKNKLYRQALFFYFSGNYSQALRQISINNQRFNAQTPKSDLFNAGLQVAIGLQQQATKTLLAIAAQQTKQATTAEQVNDTGKSATSADELLLIALLQLTEQQVEQGNKAQAQQLLAKIKHVSPAYYQQYYTLNQLAYWPAAPTSLASIIATKDQTSTQNQDNNSALNSPYIHVNQALFYIENNNYPQAENILLNVKNNNPKQASVTFWQQLFSPFVNEEIVNKKATSDILIQQQAIADYAQLLLAQMYVKQQRYNDSFIILKSFPQHSPYSEPALFLFAYAAQKTQHYDMAITLFNLLQQQYPYSNLGWQSTLLMASQITQKQEPLASGTEKTLKQALANYQKVDVFFSTKLSALKGFEHAFLTTDNLLNFSVKASPLTLQEQQQKQRVDNNIIDNLAAASPYQTSSPWLQKALQNSALKADYQHLIELDLLARHLQQQQQKSKWLDYTLTLNKTRQDKIFTTQQQHPISALITKLKARREQLAQILNLVEKQQNVQALANAKEQKWLQSITQSEDALNIIKTQRNTTDYQERLQRVNGVLQWQLSQQFIPRLWQHKTQLASIDKQLAIAQTQQQKFTHFANAHQSLTFIEKRQQQSATKINVLLNDITHITVQANQQIKATVQTFINQQRAMLTANLLTSRHSMAAILEKISFPAQAPTVQPQARQRQTSSEDL